MIESATEAHVIFLNGGTHDHQRAIQEIVKVHAPIWWHQLPNVWIVIGGGRPEEGTHRFWANLIAPVLALSDAQLLVLRLPERETDNRLFATRGRGWTADAKQWLWETYLGRPYPGRAKAVSALPTGEGTT